MKGTSCSLVALALFMTLSSGASAQTPAQIWVPCNYPNGWNSTDAHRELAGIPNGVHHQCLVESRAAYDVHRPRYRKWAPAQ